MKTIQLIFRIILSPIVLLISFAIMLVFPALICMITGITIAIQKLLGMENDETWLEILLLTLTGIIYPIMNTRNFIINAKFID